METMYAPQNNSPKATLTDAINEVTTTITVDDASSFPAAPNVLTIGTGEDAELIQYTNVTGNILTVVRGFNGTTAKSWNAGVYLYRAITAQDVSALQSNVTEVQQTLKTHTDNTTIHVTTADKEKWNNPPAPPVTSVFSRTGDITAQPGDYTPDQVGAAPDIHASQHATDGTDPLTPSSIGAAAATHASTHAADGDDPITPADIGAASTNHAATHASGGADPVSPASIGAATPPTTASVTLTASGWTGSASPYSQSVTITGATAKSKVDLQPNAAALAQLIADTVAGMYIENNGGTLTAYAVNAKPSVNLTLQVTLTEIGG